MGVSDVRDIMGVRSNTWGVRTNFGIWLPPGGRVAAFVRSTGAQDGDDIGINNNLVTTLSSALNRVRSGMGDTVIILPGHTETVGDPASSNMLANLVAGTRIFGMGTGSAKPTFTWSAAASQWALNKSDVTISGVKLNVGGANGVVKAINVTGSDNVLVDCEIVVATAAALKATIVCEVNVGGDRFQLISNRVNGTATHNVTNGFLVTGAVTGVEIIGNRMQFSATAANGLINYTGASTNNVLSDNDLKNTMTASSACVAFADVASDGIACRNTAAVLSAAATPALSGFVLAGVTTLWNFNGNTTTTAKNTSGIVSPTADT